MYYSIIHWGWFKSRGLSPFALALEKRGKFWKFLRLIFSKFPVWELAYLSIPTFLYVDFVVIINFGLKCTEYRMCIQDGCSCSQDNKSTGAQIVLHLKKRENIFLGAFRQVVLLQLLKNWFWKCIGKFYIFQWKKMCFRN